MAQKQTDTISRLITEISKLPGIGRKSAQRIAYHLLTHPASNAENLAQAIIDAKGSAKICSICANLSHSDPCPICASEKRDHTLVCVVQDAKDIITIERSHCFQGVYHVLGGSISPLQGIGARDLRIDKLIARVRQGAKEVIFATALTPDGENTAVYISGLLAPLNVKMSRIATGMPVGSDLEYTDEETVAGAITSRRQL
ncbi:MAG: recombination mediator RecR [Eubacteriaceae bacterium]|nr:recombination mediator RecR [Eubacteriaceae bacterium]